jgi:DNA-binding Lrp family transcriptional regulator
VVAVDLVDKRLIAVLMGNCRTSYRSLARQVGMSSTAVKKRVDKLVESGVIRQFFPQLRLAMLDADFFLAWITTDGSERDDEFIDQIGNNPMVLEVARVGPRTLDVGGEVSGTAGVVELSKFLRGFDCVTEVKLHILEPVFPTALPPQHKYVYRGRKVTFTHSQLRVLKCLIDDTRMPTAEIARQTELTPRRIRQILKELQEGGGILFTIRPIFGSAGINSFWILIGLNEEKKTPPHEIVKWFHEQYPYEYWNSFIFSDEPTLIHFCTAKNLQDIEPIIEAVKQAPFTEWAEAQVMYPQRKFVGMSSIRLQEMLKESGIES